jgi:hypothetical protein
VRWVYTRRTMYRLRAPFFVVLALIAACGAKVLVDSSSGDQGGGGSSIGSVGQGGTNVGTAGSFGTGAAGAYVAGGGGFYGTGGFYGEAGSFPCGPRFCSAAAVCCNSQCGICVPPGAGCPAIACGTDGGFGTGGSSGIAGAFGMGDCGGEPYPNMQACLTLFRGPLPCPQESLCLCNSCTCPAIICLGDLGCQQIWQCALKFNCRGTSCYTPQSCQKVIDQYGMGSPSMNLALRLDRCVAGSGCDNCGGAVDAGAGCSVLPPPIGGWGCTGSGGPGQCDRQCRDDQMNTYSTKCANNACTCYYDGQLVCSCFQGPNGFGGSCGTCCPGWPG